MLATIVRIVIAMAANGEAGEAVKLLAMIEAEPDSAGQLFTEGESVEATAFAALAELEPAFDESESPNPAPQEHSSDTAASSKARRDGGEHPGPGLIGPERVSTFASTGTDAKDHGELGEDQQCTMSSPSTETLFLLLWRSSPGHTG
jgi:hypothetical protein